MEPLYEKADRDTAWDALVEQSEGDESIARDVAASMVKDKEAALKKMEKASAKGATPAEKIADAKKRKADIEKARAELEHWQAIAGVSQTQADGQTDGNAVQSEMPQVAGDVAENPVGRSLNAEEADMLLSQMEQSAEVAPEMELTPENWIREFGKGDIVRTPIGDVKQGGNQYLKLAQQGRNSKLGMVRPTLERPNIIIEDERPAKEGESERNTSYVFVKTFTKDGARYYYFTSVTVSIDGMEVVISNQEKTTKRISNLLQNNKVNWINEKVQSASEAQSGKSVPLDDSRTVTQADNNTAPLGINSSELSISESIERIGENQGKSDGNAVQTIKEETITDYEGEERIDVLAGDNASGQGGQQGRLGRVDAGERDADGVGATDEIGAGARSDGFGNTDRGGIEGAVDEGQSGLPRPEAEVGMEVSVSSHYDRPKRIKDALINGKLLYRFDGGAQTEHHPADASVTASRTEMQGISMDEGSEKIGENQRKSEGNAVQSETPQVAGDVAENQVGRSLNAEEADMLISQICVGKVSKDGKEAVISSQERSGNRISKLLQQGKVAWIDIEFSLHPTTQVEGSVPLNDSNTLTYTDNQPALLGINSSELSTSEGIEKIGENQGKSERNVVQTIKEEANTDYEGEERIDVLAGDNTSGQGGLPRLEAIVF